jgi:malonyl-CoA/methylmalonyl-CoA synthetase
VSSLFPALVGGSGERVALRFGERSLTYAQLGAAAGAVAARIHGVGRVAVWATPELETAVGVVGVLLAGAAAVPLNPKSGEKELAHILSDSAPQSVLAAPGAELPAALGDLERVDVDAYGTGAVPEDRTSEGDPALIVYTSGTTGPPKGAVIPRRALATTLDALADAWQWTGDDVLVHGLPLFHVHGLVLGVLGPLRRGGSVRHLGRFGTEGVTRELTDGATMLFGVPTMYHRIAEALPGDPELAKALGRARLLVSGSAALPVHDHERITAATGQRVIERYGMTETLITIGTRAGGPAVPGAVGTVLPGIRARVLGESGAPAPADGEAIGELQVRGPTLFSGYRNLPDVTAASFTVDGWFRTGDVASVDPDGVHRIVGRSSTDLIKSGGYRIGAGEVENALLTHPAVREAAVIGVPHADLGEEIVAYVVAGGVSGRELIDFVADRLSVHKRPRTVHLVESLPRNAMGKVQKKRLLLGD